NQTVSPGGTVGPLSFVVSDAETPAAGLVVTPSSSNTTLVPVSGVQVSGTGATRTVTVTPAAGQSGTATITLAVADPGGMTATSTFTVTVPPGGGALGRPRNLSVGGAINGVANVYAPSAAGVYANPPARQI